MSSTPLGPYTGYHNGSERTGLPKATQQGEWGSHTCTSEAPVLSLAWLLVTVQHEPSGCPPQQPSGKARQHLPHSDTSLARDFGLKSSVHWSTSSVLAEHNSFLFPEHVGGPSPLASAVVQTQAFAYTLRSLPGTPFPPLCLANSTHH